MTARAKVQRFRPRTHVVWNGSLLLCSIIILCVHAWNLQNVPRGLFWDETAIGYNALLVSQTGYDERGYFLPLYFESFGDYKAPVYTYVVAVLFRAFGPSTSILRATSLLFKMQAIIF